MNILYYIFLLFSYCFYSPSCVTIWLLDLKKSKFIHLCTSPQKDKSSTIPLFCFSPWPYPIHRTLIRDEQKPGHNLNFKNLTPWRVVRTEEVTEEGVGGMPVTAVLECDARMDSALAEQLKPATWKWYSVTLKGQRASTVNPLTCLNDLYKLEVNLDTHSFVPKRPRNMNQSHLETGCGAQVQNREKDKRSEGTDGWLVHS